MRRLIVTRGIPGSGKSALLRELGLGDVTLEADAFRLRASGPAIGPDGRFSVNQANDQKVWREMADTLGARMANGDTMAVDATHTSAADFKPYRELARRHGYRIACLDLGGVPLEEADARNLARPEWRRVPRQRMEEFARRITVSEVPDGVLRIPVDSSGAYRDTVRDFLAVPSFDLSACDRVIHVGDIHGCATALRALVDRLGGIRGGDWWFFTGDALDRGLENGDAMRWLLDEAAFRDNVTLIRGNHEAHIHREALGLEPASQEFAERTRPQLREAGITPADLSAFCERLEDMVLHTWRGARVMVTHAGLSTVPSHPWLVSARQCTHGTGHYEDPVDLQFGRNAPAGWTQVHGHRNSHHVPVMAGARSVNLEGGVEFGGHLRAAVLDGSGWTAEEVPNRLFQPFRERQHSRASIVPHWMLPGTESGVVMSPELRAAMAAHPGVRERASAAFPNIVSLNFTKQVFYDRSFDSVTVKARGLFIDCESGEIAARGFEKFFGIGERPDHSPEALRERLVFPLTGWLKENGFLGNIGYDSRSGGLFVASKSATEGDFAAWVREALVAAMPEDGHREALRRFLRDREACIPCEVIEPVRDPHIVEYDRPRLVFLDVLRRATEFERLPYGDLVRAGKEFGVEVKQRAFSLPDWRAFEAWHRRHSRDFSRQIEGYVIGDASGFQFKFKTPWYAFWKLCRGMKEAVVREREGGKPSRGLDPQFLESRGLGFCAPLAEAFRAWCREQDTGTLKGSIISLRNAFEQAPVPEPSAPQGRHP